MTLADFMQVCAGDAYVSIEGYCKSKDYDYYNIPTNKWGDPDESVFSGDNPLHYVPTCLAMEPWWKNIKDREINKISIIRGSAYPVELFIRLED